MLDRVRPSWVISWLPRVSTSDFSRGSVSAGCTVVRARRRVPPAASTCAAERARPCRRRRRAGSRIDDGVVAQPRRAYSVGGGRRSRTRRRTSAPRCAAGCRARGRGSAGRSSRPRSLSGPPPSDDADGEGEEDGDERDDVVSVRDHEKSPWLGRRGRRGGSERVGPLLADGGDGDGGGEGDEAGEHHQQQVPRPHPAGVEVRHGGGVDQPRPDLEPGQVGAGQPGALAVEEARRGSRASRPPTITAASAASARIRAASSGVAADSTAQRTDAEPLELLERSPRCAPRSTRTTTSRAARSVVADGRSASSSASSTTTSARTPAARSSVGAGADADQDRVLLAQERPDRGELARRSRGRGRRRPPAGRRSGWPAGARPRPCSSRSCSRRRNSVLLWVNVSSWVASPVAGRSISAATDVGVEHAAAARPGRRRRRPRRRGAGPRRRRRSRPGRRRRRRRRPGRRRRPATCGPRFG